MTTKTVQIEIATDDLESLKSNGYNLCFAKKVNNDFNVVWQAYNNYLHFNVFQWEPSYQLFGTVAFKNGGHVVKNTNPVDISLGQQCTLDHAGVLGSPSTGGAPAAITLVNNYGPIHPGLAQLSIGINENQAVTPIYVTPQEEVAGSVELIPADQVMVWFEQSIDTNTMFSSARSNPVTMDLASTDSAIRLYSKEIWSVPGPVQIFSANLAGSFNASFYRPPRL